MLPENEQSGFGEQRADESGDRGSTAPSASAAATSVAMTMIVFMCSLALVRFLLPKLVEEVHYSIERGKQRAHYETSGEYLSQDPLSQLSSSSQMVAQRIAPSVVHIDTKREANPEAVLLDVDQDSIPSDRAQKALRGQGSGVIVDREGRILTNFHVIQFAEVINVTLSDDRQVQASVIGVDPVMDLALLQTNAKDLTPAEWGDSDTLAEGAMVWAAGSPFGLSKTITFGILSAKARRSYESGRFQEFLQSDAAVSAGNSGGPLVDSQGRLVGINTAIIGPTYQGVSFSIPVNTAREIYQRMLDGKSTERGWLGVRLSKAEIKGARIVGLVHPESPARHAGIVAGDVITGWNNKVVDSPSALTDLLDDAEVNTQVRLKVMREGSQKTLRVAIGPRPLQFQ